MGTKWEYRDRNQLGDYLRRIAAYAELDRELELELARRYLEGDRQAGEVVINAHLRDVVVLARLYKGRDHALIELIAAGNLGLVRALERFDPSRGLRFMTYAGYLVRAEIFEHIVSTWSAVGVGKSGLQRQLFFKLRRARARLEAGGLSGAVLDETLAEEFDCSVARIHAMLQRLDQRDATYDAIRENREVEDNPELSYAAEESRQRLSLGLARGLDNLDERERMIVERRFLSSESRPSRGALGAELGISGERVRQLENRAMAKIRVELTTGS